MGYRGPIPKPTTFEILEGRPGHRPINRNEPKPRNVAPKCPEHLDEKARREWRRIVPILMRMRVLTEADGYALASLCQTYSTMVKAQEKLNETGFLYKSPSGYVMQSPVLAVVNQCIETIVKLSREFGLTPAARSRVITTAAEPELDLLELALSQPRRSDG